MHVYIHIYMICILYASPFVLHTITANTMMVIAIYNALWFLSSLLGLRSIIPIEISTLVFIIIVIILIIVSVAMTSVSHATVVVAISITAFTVALMLIVH